MGKRRLKKLLILVLNTSINNWVQFMNSLKKTLLALFILSLTSCATNYEEEKKVLLSRPDGQDLVTAFDVEKDQAEKFKSQVGAEQPVAEAPVAEEKKPAPNKKEKKPVKAAAKEASKSTPVAVVAPTVKVSHLNPQLPADYPEAYKGYDAKSKEVWSKFKPVFYKGEQSIMSISYLGVTAGYITIISKDVVKLNNKEAFHFYARFKSSDAYRYFYWLDDRLESYVEKETFLPIKYTLIQREKKQNVDDLQLFDYKKMMTYHWYKRVKEGSNKDEKIDAMIPSLSQDSFSALQLVRGLPLNKGDIYEFPVVTRGKFWLLKVEVMGEETINVSDKEVKATRIRAETNFPGVLKKSGDIIFWYGTDPERKLLKFQAKVKIGSIYGELVEYKPGVRVE